MTTVTLNLPQTTSTTISPSAHTNVDGTSFTDSPIPAITSVATLSSVTVLAPLIQLNWKSPDRRILTTAPPRTSSSATTAVSTITEGTPLTTPTPAKRSLSSGAKAAIGTTVPLVILISAAILVILLRRRRNANRRSYYQGKPELDASNSTKAFFVSPAVPAELSALDQPHELEPEERQELEPEERHELAAPVYLHELGSSEPSRNGENVRESRNN
ncbi:MAG: hypothetical protein M1820_010014 [Bogoriella megaspora]|nr:MAG: hypothetical protein M1820_010014 [Bogoriella megaspora]